jgi:prepilin signal peptidase PulO-like enzyme (type II secretory pathway)
MFLFFIFFLGLLIGSFLNVLADRLSTGESPFKGRSYCNNCKRTLAWIDLIPVFSFVFLKGKCRYCKASLSVYYPLVEVTTGALFIAVLFFLGVESTTFITVITIISAIYLLLIVSALVVIFFADLKYGIIPDGVIVFLFVIALPYLLFVHNSLFINHLFSGIGALIFFLFLFLITRGKGMGFGDVKFSFVMGLILGFPGIVVSLYIAFLTGAAIGSILLLWKRQKVFGVKIPFGPFLVFGFIITLFFGDIILEKITAVLLL